MAAASAESLRAGSEVEEAWFGLGEVGQHQAAERAVEEVAGQGWLLQ